MHYKSLNLWLSLVLWLALCAAGWIIDTDDADADPATDLITGTPRHLSCTDTFRRLVLTENPGAAEAAASFGADLKFELATANEPDLTLMTALSGSSTMAPNPTTGATSTVVPKTENLFSLDYVRLVGADIKDIFTAPARWDTKDWLMFGIVSAGIGVTTIFEEDIQKAVQRNRAKSFESGFDKIQQLGDSYSFGVLGAFYVGGLLAGDDNAKAVAQDGLSASIIAGGLIATPLKDIVGRRRPDKNLGAHHFEFFSRNQSFPSGHTTQAFAVATVVADHYDSIWIKTAAFGLASGVGYARILNNAHWTSDVLAGAALGYFVGHEVVKFNRNHRINLTPMVSRDFKGLGMDWEF